MQKGTISPSVATHVYGNVQKSQENVRQKHLLCQSILEISMAGLHRPSDVFYLWKQEIQHDDSRFMDGRRRIVLDVCVGDP
jgi:hypothetical protein